MQVIQWLIMNLFKALTLLSISLLLMTLDVKL
jgi:hypothetical protein